MHGELRRLCRRDELALRGDHNLLNSLAAAAAACAAGAPAWPRPPPRCAPSRACRTASRSAGVVDGVTYVNDSKATNVDATLKALTAYSGGVHLILGGYDKGAEYDELAAGQPRAACARCCSSARRRRSSRRRSPPGPPRSGRAPRPCVVCGDLETAVAAAAAAAAPGDVVLLSPACASWDQYRDYEQRGEHFLRAGERAESKELTAT